MRAGEKEIQLLRAFGNTINLPVILSERGKILYQLPDPVATAAQIAEAESLALTPGSVSGSGGVLYIQTPAGENYLSLALSDGLEIAVGPCLLEPPLSGAAAALVRAGKLKLRCRAAVQAYLESLPVITDKQYFYAGKVLEQLFLPQTEKRTQEPPEQPEAPRKTATEFISSAYYRQTYNYRMEQFRHSPYLLEQEICRTISNGDTVKAHYILNEINSRPRARLANNAFRSLKNSVICSCTFMARAAISGGMGPDEAFTLSDAYIQRIEECADMAVLLHFEEEMIKGYTEKVNALRRRKYSSAVYQALSYIDAHLCDTIRLEDVAGAVFLNPNYLSGVFARETGETVHACIIRRRIEEAAFYVRNTTESIADIASLYQFSSQSHFVQSFRKVMGITPGACRNGKQPKEGQERDNEGAIKGR